MMGNYFIHLHLVIDGPDFYLDPLSIEGIERSDSGGSTVWTQGHSFLIQETPEEIMALISKMWEGYEKRRTETSTIAPR